MALLLRDPVLVEPDELLEELEQRVAVKRLSWRAAPRVTGQLWKSVRGGRTGSAILCALRFMRFMFMSGRNIVTLPLASRYALSPSKRHCA